MSETPDTATLDQETPTPEPQEPPDAPDAPPEGDTPEEPSDEPTEAQDAPQEPASDMLAEEQFKKLDSERKRHTNAITRLVGDEEAQQLELCPFCEPFQGFRFDVPLDAEQQQAALELLGQATANDLQEAPDARKCDACNGLGEVLTGSRKPNQRVKMCATCQGNGWMKVAGPQGNGHEEAPPPAAPDTGAAPAKPVQFYDAYGRQLGDPDFGNPPAPVVTE